MKETRPLSVVIAEIEGTIVPDLLIPMYQHPLYTGFALPRAIDIPDGMEHNFISFEHVVESKITAFNAAIDDGDPYAAIMIMTERPFRLHKFLEWDKAANWDSPSQRIELIRDVWVDCESPHINQDIWRELWSYVLRAPQHMEVYTLEEMNQREQLDEIITLYRGTTRKEGQTPGLSWTTSRERAEWFANRWQNTEHVGTPCVWEAPVNRDYIIGPIHQRGEEEFIIPAKSTLHTRTIHRGEH